MILSQKFLIFIYAVIVILNYYKYKTGESKAILTAITTVFSVFMLCATNVANYDWSVTEADLSGYRTIYELYDIPEHEDYNLYFIFYRLLDFGHSIGISFRTWWEIMSVLAMTVIIIACKIHKYNFNLFLATFMAYYEIVFYTGLKFFYGFCFLLLAFGFLLRNTRKDRIIYALIVFIAAGFHVMYWLFLLLLLKPQKRPKVFVYSIVIISVLMLIISRFNSSALHFIGSYLSGSENEHIAGINGAVVIRAGLYIVLFVHLLTIYLVYQVREYIIKNGKKTEQLDTLFYSVLVSLLLSPLYTIGFTFMRYITAFSLVAITACSSFMDDSYNSRRFCMRVSLALVAALHLIRIIIGGFYTTEAKQFFDIF